MSLWASDAWQAYPLYSWCCIVWSPPPSSVHKVITPRLDSQPCSRQASLFGLPRSIWCNGSASFTSTTLSLITTTVTTVTTVHILPLCTYTHKGEWMNESCVACHPGARLLFSLAPRPSIKTTIGHVLLIVVSLHNLSNEYYRCCSCPGNIFLLLPDYI